MKIIVIFSILPAVLCTDFKSVPTTVKTYENDTVLLPCYLDSTGTEETGGIPESIRWYKDTELIAYSESAANDAISDRVKLWTNGSLQVANVRNTDTGEYMCEVVRKEPWTSIKQLHAIEVQESPTVESNPSSGFLQVKLGEEVKMSCSASGVPYPLMTWTSKGTEMKLLDNRQTLKFPATDRHLSGIYECIASNGVGTPAKAKIELSIIYPPEVTTSKSWIHTSPGLRATLECTVSADPRAEVKWYKSNMAVPFDARVISLFDGDKHMLIIRNVRPGDFGIYTCRATNELGRVEVDIQLSGVANPCIFKEIEQKVDEKLHKSFTLVWEVDSYSPIIEYNLLFRPYQVALQSKRGEWTKLTIPAEHSTGPMHSKSYTLTGLKENTVYEAMLFSRNRYGWSKPSNILRFSIDGTEIKEEVVTQISPLSNIILTRTITHYGWISSSTRNTCFIPLLICMIMYFLIKS